MAQYNPHKLKRLIQLCCWQNKAEPNAKGFERLVACIEEAQEAVPALKKEYLQNLWTDVHKAIREKSTVHKSDVHINELLSHCEYISWIEFSEEYDKIVSLLSPKVDVSSFPEVHATIFTDPEEMDALLPLIPYGEKLVNYSIRRAIYTPESDQTFNYLLEHSAYVLSFFQPQEAPFPFDSGDRDAIQELLDSHRFIPIWSGNPNSRYAIRLLNNTETIIGLRGLLLAFLVLDYWDEVTVEERNDLHVKSPTV